MQEVKINAVLPSAVLFEQLEISRNGETLCYLSKGTLTIRTIQTSKEFSLSGIKQFRYVSTESTENIIYQQGNSVYYFDIKTQQKSMLLASDECESIILHSFKKGFVIVVVNINSTDFNYYSSSFKSVYIPKKYFVVKSSSSNFNCCSLLHDSSLFILRSDPPISFSIGLPELLPFKNVQTVVPNENFSTIAFSPVHLPSLPGKSVDIIVASILNVVESIEELQHVMPIINEFKQIKISEQYGIKSIHCVGRWVMIVVYTTLTRVLIYDSKTEEIFMGKEGKNVIALESRIPMYLVDGYVYVMTRSNSFSEVAIKMLTGGFDSYVENLIDINNQCLIKRFIIIEQAVEEGKFNIIQDIICSLNETEMIPTLTVFKNYLKMVSKKERALKKNGKIAECFQQLYQKIQLTSLKNNLINFRDQYEDCVEIRREIYDLEQLEDKKVFNKRFELSCKKFKDIQEHLEKTKQRINSTFGLISFSSNEDNKNIALINTILDGNLLKLPKNFLNENGWKYVYYLCKEGDISNAFKVLMRMSISDVLKPIKELAENSIDVEMRRVLYDFCEDSESLRLMREFDYCYYPREEKFDFIIREVKGLDLHSDFTFENSNKYGFKLSNTTKIDNNSFFIGNASKMNIPFTLVKKLDEQQLLFLALEMQISKNSCKPWDVLRYYAIHNKIKEGINWIQTNIELINSNDSTFKEYLKQSPLEFRTKVQLFLESKAPIKTMDCSSMNSNIFIPYYETLTDSQKNKSIFHWMEVWNESDDIEMSLLMNSYDYHLFKYPKINKEELIQNLPSQFESRNLLAQTFPCLMESNEDIPFNLEEANMHSFQKDCSLFEMYDYSLKTKHTSGKNVIAPYLPKPTFSVPIISLNIKYFIVNNQPIHALFLNFDGNEIESICQYVDNPKYHTHAIVLGELKENKYLRIEVALHESLKGNYDRMCNNQLLSKHMNNIEGLKISFKKLDGEAKKEILRLLEEKTKSGTINNDWNVLSFLYNYWNIKKTNIPLQTLALTGQLIDFLWFIDQHKYSTSLLPLKWGETIISIHGATFCRAINENIKYEGVHDSLKVFAAPDNYLHFLFNPQSLQSLIYAIECFLSIEHSSTFSLEYLGELLMNNCVEHVDVLTSIYMLYDHTSPIYCFLKLLLDVQIGLKPETKELIESINNNKQYYGENTWVLNVIAQMLDKLISYYEINSPHRMRMLFEAASELINVEDIKKKIGQYEATKKISLEYSLKLNVSTPSKQLVSILCEKKLFDVAYEFVEKYDMCSYSYIAICQANLMNKDWDKNDNLFVTKKVFVEDVIDYYENHYQTTKNEGCSDGNYRVYNKKLKDIINHQLMWIKQMKNMVSEEENAIRLIGVYSQCEKENVPPESILTPTPELCVDIINMGNITTCKKISNTVPIPEIEPFERVVKFVANKTSYSIPLEEGIKIIETIQENHKNIYQGIEIYKKRYEMIYKHANDINSYIGVIDSTFLFQDKRLELIGDCLSIKNLSKYSSRIKEWERIFNEIGGYIRVEKIADLDILPLIASTFIGISKGVQPVMTVGWLPNNLKAYIKILRNPTLICDELLQNTDTSNCKLFGEIIQCCYCAANIFNSSEIILKAAEFFFPHLAKFQNPDNICYLFDLIVKTKAFDDFTLPSWEGPVSPIRIYLKSVYEENKDYKKLLVQTKDEDWFIYQAYYRVEFQNFLDTIPDAIHFCHIDSLASDLFGYTHDYEIGGEFFYRKGLGDLENFSKKLETGFFNNPREGLVYLLTASKMFCTANSFFDIEKNAYWTNKSFIKCYLIVMQLVYDNVQLVGLKEAGALRQIQYFTQFYDAYIFSKEYSILLNPEDWYQVLYVQCVTNSNQSYFDQWCRAFKMNTTCLDLMYSHLLENAPFIKKSAYIKQFEVLKEKCLKKWPELVVGKEPLVVNGYINTTLRQRILNTELTFNF